MENAEAIQGMYNAWSVLINLSRVRRTKLGANNISLGIIIVEMIMTNKKSRPLNFKYVKANAAGIVVSNVPAVTANETSTLFKK